MRSDFSLSTIRTERTCIKHSEKRHLQINKRGEKKKHVWLSGRLHIEGRVNEGPRLQRKRKDENEANSTTMSDNLEWRRRYECCLKKNLNASRPSVNNIPHRGKNVKTLRWDQRLQRQNLSWHLNGFPDGSNIGSTV